MELGPTAVSMSRDGAIPLATILIPTWDAPDTLGAAIDSALQQSVDALEILVVSDGALPGTLAVARQHAALDERVRVLELPKAPGRGEANRHAGVMAARAEAIVYLADDDLLLPRHVENLLGLLNQHDLVQSRNGWIDVNGDLRLLAAELAAPVWHEFHLLEPPLNRISITGTAHSAAVYRALDSGWARPDRPELPADLALWRRILSVPGVRAATHPEMTTLQFPSPERRGAGEARFAAVRAEWEAFLRRPDAHDALQQRARDAAYVELLTAGLDLRAVTVALHRETERTAEVSRELDAHRATLSWRATRPLRALRARIPRKKRDR